jgi:hypothetical protein
LGELFSTLAKSNPSYGIQHDRWQMEGASHGFIHLPEYRETVAYYMDLFLKKHGFLSGPPVVFPDPSHQYTLEATTP